MPKPVNHVTSATRGKILAVAKELFAARGYFGVSMQDLADTLGVSKAALYYHFPGKEKLFLAAVEKVFTALWGEIREASRQSRNPAEALVRVLETYLSFTLERPEAALLRQPAGAGLEREVSRTIINVNRQIKKFFEELFREAAEDEQSQHQALREMVEALTLFFSQPARVVKKNQVKKVVALLLRPLSTFLKKSK